MYVYGRLIDAFVGCLHVLLLAMGVGAWQEELWRWKELEDIRDQRMRRQVRNHAMLNI